MDNTYGLYWINKMIDLKEFRKNIYQNYGVKECPHYSEDGVILKIFKEIGVDKKHKKIVEFGEMRVLGTTTRSFRIKYFPYAVYFTQKIDLISKLLNIFDIIKITIFTKKLKYLSFLGNMPFEFFVTPKNIINILQEKLGKSKEIDILTIDIDSYDYFVAKVILENNYKPRLLILEYNPFLPIDIPLSCPNTRSLDNKPKNKKVYGASYLAMDNLATNYGYKLVHVSGFCNLFYISNEYSDIFTSPDINVELTDSDEKVKKFIDIFCQKGFVPSWMEEESLSKSDLTYFERV